MSQEFSFQKVMDEFKRCEAVHLANLKKQFDGVPIRVDPHLRKYDTYIMVSQELYDELKKGETK